MTDYDRTETRTLTLPGSIWAMLELMAGATDSADVAAFLTRLAHGEWAFVEPDTVATSHVEFIPIEPD